MKTIDDRRLLRAVVLEHLGGKCVVCGWNDYRALQIDHILGDGSQERATPGYDRLRFLVGLLDDPQLADKYQLLCANHNWIKKVENNEIRKPRPRTGEKRLDQILTYVSKHPKCIQQDIGKSLKIPSGALVACMRELTSRSLVTFEIGPRNSHFYTVRTVPKINS